MIIELTFSLAIILPSLVTLTSFNNENNLSYGFFDLVKISTIVAIGTVEKKSIAKFELK